MDAISQVEQMSYWAEELKQQLDAAGETIRAEGGQSEESPVTLQLSISALEMLTSAIDEIIAPADPTCREAACERPESRLAESIATAIDGSMAAWRSEIELSLAESATRQLESQLKQVAELNAALSEREKSLDQRESRLATQTSQLQGELAASLRIQARTERQRKTLAAGFRRQRAEQRLAQANDAAQRHATERHESSELTAKISELKVELEQSNAQRDDLSEQTNHLRKQEGELLAEVATLKERLANHEATAADTSTDELELKICQLEEDNARLEERLGDHHEKLDEELLSENARLQQAIDELNATVEALEKQAAASEELTEQLLNAEAELEELRNAPASDSCDTSEELESALQRVEQLEQQIFEQEQLAQTPTHEPNDLAHTAHVEELEMQLTELQEEIQRLQAENDRLVANEHSMPPGGNRPHVSFNQESLSWEERKKLIMDQLEHDDSPQTSETHANRLEIESILETTQAEIDRREREITELQAIVEQQSDTKQGVAIGAAAIAQMLDDDELVVQEREKLKSLQGEWEDKVRQAEIDISMERAKLARQRSEVESKVAELEAQLAKHGGTLPPAPTADTAAGGRTRKWLEHLGLKDDPS